MAYTLSSVFLVYIIQWTPYCQSRPFDEISQWLTVNKNNPRKIDVSSYYGEYLVEDKVSGLPAPSLIGPVSEQWESSEKANRPYRIAVLFPHLKDPYWIAVNYGITYQANSLGVSMDLLHTNGYRNLGRQVKQMDTVLRSGKYDGLIIGAVQFKKSKLEDMYIKYKQAGIPIVSVVNDTYTPSIDAKSLVDWRKLGYQAGQFLVQHSNTSKIRIAIMPGAKGTGWAPDTLDGIKTAIKDFKAEGRVDLVEILWGDTGDKAQRHLINVLLKKHQNIDYIIGNALAVTAAVTSASNGSLAPIEKFSQSHPHLQLISTYLTQDIYQLIEQNKVLASPTDLMKDQGIIAMDMMVRILNGQVPGKDMPFRIGPHVPIIHQKNIHQWQFERLFGPRDFKAIKELNLQKSDVIN